MDWDFNPSVLYWYGTERISTVIAKKWKCINKGFAKTLVMTTRLGIYSLVQAFLESPFEFIR